MKKLSIEEKAKAYDEAIEYAQYLMNERCKEGSYGSFHRLDLERMFPEIKESEDKRIRAALIRYFTLSDEHAYNQAYGVSYRDIVAWLIKQSEQKPTWSEDDGYYYGIIQYILNNECVGKTDKEEAINWFKSLKDRVVPQPKQEWSQNDIDMIDWLIRCCEKEHEELCNDKYGHQDIVSDLKRDCRKKWNWLESLRNKVVHQNTWKPSKEQMEALKQAKTDACGKPYFNVLASLYVNLKGY